MFNIGGGELLVIALIALIVLGPERLPGAARQIGKTMGDLRRLSSGFQEELRGALDAEPTAPTTPRRDVLGGGTSAGADGSVSAALRSVSGEGAEKAADPESKPSPRRRAPLVAGPETTNGRKPDSIKPAAKGAGTKKTGAARAGARSPGKKAAASPSRRRSS